MKASSVSSRLPRRLRRMAALVGAAALCGAVMAGRGLAESAEIAGEFVRHAMVSTRNQPHFEDRGVSFELNLGELTDLVK